MFHNLHHFWFWLTADKQQQLDIDHKLSDHKKQTECMYVFLLIILPVWKIASVVFSIVWCCACYASPKQSEVEEWR